MELFREEMSKVFALKSFKKSLIVTWFFIFIGIVVFIFFMVISGLIDKKNYFHFFIRNIGIYSIMISILMAFAAVYKMNSRYGRVVYLRHSIVASYKRLHYIVGGTVASLLIFLIISLVETGISALASIPYAGPLLVAMLTAPFFIINMLCLLAVICVFALLPPVIGETDGFKESMVKMKLIIRDNGFNVILYLIISIAVFSLSLVIVFLIIQYAVGITKSIQWKVNAAYPPLLSEKLSMSSYLTEVVDKITPKADPFKAFMKYKSKLFDYLTIFRYIIGFSYFVIFSFVISFPLAAYFNFSTSFFRRTFKNQLK